MNMKGKDTRIAKVPMRCHVFRGPILFKKLVKPLRAFGFVPSSKEKIINSSIHLLKFMILYYCNKPYVGLNRHPQPADLQMV